eukprot:356922-Chlamydomonas_euryale.AAC.5
MSAVAPSTFGRRLDAAFLAAATGPSLLLYSPVLALPLPRDDSTIYRQRRVFRSLVVRFYSLVTSRESWVACTTAREVRARASDGPRKKLPAHCCSNTRPVAQMTYSDASTSTA